LGKGTRNARAPIKYVAYVVTAPNVNEVEGSTLLNAARIFSQSFASTRELVTNVKFVGPIKSRLKIRFIFALLATAWLAQESSGRGDLTNDLAIAHPTP